LPGRRGFSRTAIFWPVTFSRALLIARMLLC
jgi:hypothetical protein